MKNKTITVEERLKKLKRKFIIITAVLSLVILLLGFYIYLNYDYLAFKHFMTGFYIYTDTLDELYAKELKSDVKGSYYQYFDDVVISVLTRRIREINNDRYTYLYTPERYKEYKKEEKEEALLSEIKVLDDRNVYLRLSNFSKYTEKFMKDNTKLLSRYPGIIIDLRDNYGGDIDAMAAISGLFLPKGSIIATDKLRLLDWVYKARGGKVLNFEKIIILQNRNTASASENMIAALKDNLDNVILIGEDTFGKGIGQYTLPLKKGFAAKATILKWFTPNGVNIQGKGIKPDIPYTDSDIIEYAVENLKEGK